MNIHNIADRATDLAAVGAVASPFWLPGLQDLSETAALLLPIAGLFWLIVQIFHHLRTKTFNKD